ncbi:MAG: TIGR04282 family arsenosugar biosynthesis glycosyltransferase [Nitrospirota bacterium]
MSTRCVLMFIKAPEKGAVKSRLAKDLGDEAALELYRCFVVDMINTLRASLHPFMCCFYPPDALEKIVAWLGRGYSYLPQSGNDLGERMRNAFIDIFNEGVTEVVIIGSDSPDLPAEIIDEAFRSLHHHDVVIGPAFDGGYYLIGFKRDAFLPELFEAIPWSTGAVFEQTVDILRKKRYKMYILPEWGDVDCRDDLMALFRRNRNTPFASSRTMSYLFAHKEVTGGRI